MLKALDLRNVCVAVDDCLAVLEACCQPRFPPEPRPGVVNHADPDVLDLHHPLLHEDLLQRRLIHVPGDALNRWPDPSQLLEELQRNEIAAVQDEIGACEQPHALVGERPRAAREVRIGDDGDSGQEAATGSGATARGSPRKCPAFQTSSPSA